MPKSNSVPSYKLHKPTGQARVIIGGRHFYLGKYGTAESESKRKADRRSNRKTKVQPSQEDRSKPKAKRRPGTCYGKDALNNAIKRACEKAGIAPWSANRLRHSAATAIRKPYGLEAAQVILGHSKADVTQIYAERDLAKAAAIISEVG